jgi:ribosome-binding protein aMBF1 (putative translation factor)
LRLGALLESYRNYSGARRCTEWDRKAMTQRALAEEIGVSASTVCRLERGQSVSGAALIKVLSWAFGGAAVGVGQK